MRKLYWSILIAGTLAAGSQADGNVTVLGERLFKEYCWGCHHQTAEAFGPSFKNIANKRNKGEIVAQIIDPANTSGRLGYKRSSMPAFDDLNATEVDLLADFILSFKDKR